MEANPCNGRGGQNITFNSNSENGAPYRAEKLQFKHRINPL